MRIIAGRNRGKKLATLPGTRTRPTSDRVKEALFNILGDRVVGALVLDLFAGCGALGLEALSRGAKKAVFIDNHRPALDIIHRNVEACDRLPQSRIFKWNLEQNLDCLAPQDSEYDMIFMDPPYDSGLIQTVLAHLDSGNLLANGAWVMAEHGLGNKPPETEVNQYGLKDQRRYGKTLISIWEYRNQPQPKKDCKCIESPSIPDRLTP